MIKCIYCNDTGKFKKPSNEEAFDKEFDKLYDGGQFNASEARVKALNKTGYTIIDCPYCNSDH